MPNELVATVALRASLGPNRPAVLSYRVPQHMCGQLRPGQLVWVPLRRTRVQGVVLQLEPADALAGALRELDDLADHELSLTPAGLKLAPWLAATYQAPLYDALALLLPPGVTQDSEVTWRATPAGLAAELGALPERERAILYYLRLHGEQGEQTLRRVLRGADAELRSTYAALAERGLVARGAKASRPAVRPRTIRCARLAIPTTELETALAQLARAPRQAAALRWLAQQTSAVPLRSITSATQASSTTLRELERRGLVLFETHEQRRDPLAKSLATPDQPPMLTAEQRMAYVSIVAALEHEIGDRKQEIGDRQQEIGDRTQGIGDRQQEIGDRQQEIGDRTQEIGDRKQEIGDRKQEIGDRQQEIGDRKQGIDASPPSSLIPHPSSLIPHPSSLIPHPSSLPPTFLLHGVTGSGKTEVYLRVIARALRLGRQALVLVPEIALTTQLVRRFAARFPDQLAVLHSALGLGERYDEWRRLRRGEARVAIGSRSAVFAPLPELGLIVVDEEHELSYKHDSSPRYHARDVALQLAALTSSITILGSATPAVESFQRAQQGEYQLLTLTERVGGNIGADGLPRSQPLPLPRVRLIDMRHELQDGNRSIFSQALQQALQISLERKEQSILFLNRRGAASFVLCRDCGHVIGCKACSGPMTVHYDEHDGQTNAQSSTLICHSCSARAPMPYICPACLSRRIRSFGIGTQRVVEEVAALLPQARVLRWDRDTSGGKGAHDRMLDAMLHGEIDILVGTQMIAKGLDLPRVGLVGVVAADTGLHLPDFRSGERAFQLLTQVAGRAGRRNAEGQVIIQSYDPEHYALRAAQEHDYAAFFSQEIAFRRETGYPPFSRLVRLIYAASDAARAQREAEHLADQIERSIKQRKLIGWSIVGPAPAFIQRSRGRWRWHLILRVPSHEDEAALHKLLESLLPAHGWIIDVDPVHVL